MLTLSQILTNQSRMQVMRSLLLSSSPVSLRELSYRTDTPLRSVQIILKVFLKEKIVKRHKLRNRTFYQAINETANVILIREFIDKINVLNIQTNSLKYFPRAKYVLKSLTDMKDLVSRARKDYANK